MKRSPLVCQHLENVSREVLEQYQDIVRQYIRRRNGIYALFRRGKLYYVGLARNLRGRLKQHLRDRHGDSWDRFSVYLTIGDTHMKELETLLLRIMKPPGNQQEGNFPKSENLKKRLARDIKSREWHRLKGLFDPSVASDGRGGKRKPSCKDDDQEAVLARYITRPLRLRSIYKGQTFRAKIGQNGVIRFRGKRYATPSMAGAVAKGRGSCNGWIFWQYERAPGDWVRLDELRR